MRLPRFFITVFASVLFLQAFSAAAQNDEFAVLQARAGVSVIDDACLATLPTFKGTAKFMKSVGAKKVGKAWELGGGALVLSLHKQGSRSGCLTTIMGTSKRLVLENLKRTIGSRFGRYSDRTIAGEINLFFEGPSGPARALVLADLPGGITVMVEPKPN